MDVCENVTGTLRASMGGNQPIVMATQQGGAEIAEGVCPTITASAGMSGNNQPVLKLYYANSDKKRVIFEVRTIYDQDHINVNTETNDMEEIIIDGDPTHMIIWSAESFYFSIICDTTKNDAVKIAESTKIK